MSVPVNDTPVPGVTAFLTRIAPLCSSACSTITTASAPRGSMPPVEIEAAVLAEFRTLPPPLLQVNEQADGWFEEQVQQRLQCPLPELRIRRSLSDQMLEHPIVQTHCGHNPAECVVESHGLNTKRTKTQSIRNLRSASSRSMTSRNCS